MKDIHNHLIFGIDDGSESIETSIKILNEMSNRGVTEIVLTPHYIIGTNYNCNNKNKKEKLEELQKSTSIKLYLGNEVFIDNNILENIDNNNISTINNSKYLLVELPLREKLDIAYDILFNLRNKGIVPIIAHPERYHYIDLNTLVEYINLGCILQGNITSLLGKYGKSAKENLELLIKKQMIYVLGTDTHHDCADLEKCYEILDKLVNKELKEDLLSKNFDKIINNQDIETYKILDTSTFFKKERIKWNI